jgi:hypothetical protein
MMRLANILEPQENESRTNNEEDKELEVNPNKFELFSVCWA